MVNKKEFNYQDKIYKNWIKRNIKKKECCICGIKKNLEIHHKVPYELGGLNTIDNVIYLCTKHHKEIHSERRKNKNQRYYLKRIGELRKKYRKNGKM